MAAAAHGTMGCDSRMYLPFRFFGKVRKTLSQTHEDVCPTHYTLHTHVRCTGTYVGTVMTY